MLGRPACLRFAAIVRYQTGTISGLLQRQVRLAAILRVNSSLTLPVGTFSETDHRDSPRPRAKETGAQGADPEYRYRHTRRAAIFPYHGRLRRPRLCCAIRLFHHIWLGVHGPVGISRLSVGAIVSHGSSSGKRTLAQDGGLILLSRKTPRPFRNSSCPDAIAVW